MNGKSRQEVGPYEVLAVGYDLVMDYVDYSHWAGYIQDLLEKHHPSASSILELGCGTGSFALHMQPLGSYRYVGTDRSETMIRVARRKARRDGTSIQFEVADFTRYQVEHPVDVVVLLYDGLNYVLEDKQVHALLSCTFQALRPGGLFVFDQSTPVNSETNEADFEDEGRVEGFHYVRRSRYDPEHRLHTTTFEIEVAGQQYHERHVQRAYEMEEIRSLVRETPFSEEAAYDGFTTSPAGASSERVHWVLRR